jgi:spore maturation protein SpmB
VADFLMVVFRDGVVASLLNIARICLILVPVMIFIEIARQYRVLEIISDWIKPFMHFLSLPKEAAFPLLAALLFGIVLGSAVIIEYSREGFLNKRDLLLTGIFMCICHSIMEDTFIFATVGANPLIFPTFRLILAVLITRLAAAFLDYRAGKDPGDLLANQPKNQEAVSNK